MVLPGLVQVHPCITLSRLLSRKVLVRPYTPPAQHQTTCIFKRLRAQTFAKNAGLSSSESHLCYLPETIDPCIRAKLRMCGTLLPDLLRQESRMSATWMCSSASGSKVPHSLSFPNEQWFLNQANHPEHKPRKSVLFSPLNIQKGPHQQWRPSVKVSRLNRGQTHASIHKSYRHTCHRIPPVIIGSRQVTFTTNSTADMNKPLTKSIREWRTTTLRTRNIGT